MLRSERDKNASSGIRKNNYIIYGNIGGMNTGDEDLVMVTQPVKDLCSSVDAFIYVVDSTYHSNGGKALTDFE